VIGGLFAFQHKHTLPEETCFDAHGGTIYAGTHKRVHMACQGPSPPECSGAPVYVYASVM
jgi:hypothetical protein